MLPIDPTGSIEDINKIFLFLETMKTKRIQIRVPEEIVEKIDKELEKGPHSSRQDFIKDKLRDIFKEEKQNYLKESLGAIKNKLPKGWELYTWGCPIQYKKIIEIKGQKYEGYLRSRGGYPFSIEIFKLDKKGERKGEEPIWTHKSVDKEKDNPPLKSMKLIDNYFKKSREKNKAGERKI